jgi:1,4-alpha-glucan branching enzyme
MSEENVRRQEELIEQIEKVLEQEEIYKMQRSRVNWMANGDRNSAYFHNFARARRKRNMIVKLKDSNREIREGNSLIKLIITNYFYELFSSEVAETNADLLQKVKPKVTRQR